MARDKKQKPRSKRQVKEAERKALTKERRRVDEYSEAQTDVQFAASFVADFAFTVVWEIVASAGFVAIMYSTDRHPVVGFYSFLVYFVFICLLFGQFISGIVGNPSMAIAFCVRGYISVTKLAELTLSNMVGRTVGLFILRELLLPISQKDLLAAAFKPHPETGYGPAIVCEALLTAALAYSSFYFGPRGFLGRVSNSLIGAALIWVGVGWTGGIMNPSAAFAYATMSGDFEYHSVYWLGPFTGGALGAMLFNITHPLKLKKQ